MENIYRICISSPPDRKKLVAEIFFGDFQWAELNLEGEETQLEIYSKPDRTSWNLPSWKDVRKELEID
jgi:hypothetical protein